MPRKTPEQLAQEHHRRNYPDAELPQEDEELPQSNDDYDDDDQQDDEPQANDELEELRREIAALRNQNDSLQGRVGPVQQKLEQYRSMYEKENEERSRYQQEIEALRQQVNEKKSEFKYEDVLTEDELKSWDQDTLDMIKKISTHIARQNMPDVDSRLNEALSRQQQNEINQYRDQILRDSKRKISHLSYLSTDPKFIDWVENESDVAKPLMLSLSHARSKQEVDRYAKSVEREIANYLNGSKDSSTKSSASTDARTSLDRANQRRPKQTSENDIKDQMAEAKRLLRTGSRADKAKAKEIIDNLP